MKRFTIFLLFISYYPVFSQEPVEFSRDKTYERLTISKDGLKKLMKSLEYYHYENPTDSTSVYIKPSISCEVGRDNESQTLNGFGQMEKIEFDDKDFTELNIIYSNSRKPISSINLNLSSNYRKLSIKGTDQKKVNALFRELDEQLTTSEDFLGFVNWSAILTATSFCLFMLAQFILFQIKPQENNSRDINLVRIIKSGCIIFIIGCLVFLFSPFKLDDWFPGFTLTSNPTHWWDKYGNFIGVFSFLGPAIYGTFRFLSKILVSATATPQDNTPTSEEPTPPNVN